MYPFFGLVSKIAMGSVYDGLFYFHTIINHLLLARKKKESFIEEEI